MPTHPKNVNLEKDTANILNSVRNDIGGSYKSAVPVALSEGDTYLGEKVTRVASVNSLHEIGSVLQNMPDMRNDFLSAIMNRIVRVIVTSKLYRNPWAFLKRGILELGEVVEEIFVNIAKPHQFDPIVAENEVFKREIPDVQAAFHKMNYQKFYKVTVSNEQLRQAFLTWEGLTDLISKIIESLYTSANYHEFLMMKYMLARMALNGYLYPLAVPPMTADNARSITTSIKGISNLLTFMSPNYNFRGVPNYTNKDDQFLILNAQSQAFIDVEVLSAAFNMDKAEFMGHIIMVDSFAPTDAEMSILNELLTPDPEYTPFTEDELTQLQNVPAMLIDREFLMIFDNLETMTENYNGQGLYYNYFYHVWKTFSASPFANAIVMSTETPTVTSVTITPTAVTVKAGANTQLNATVAGTGFVSQGVIFAMTGNQSSNSFVSPTGYVHIGSDETASSITIKAYSSYDRTKTATATITVG